MAETFDPYYTWLAIPPEEQPPDYYRLLGVRPFETNADVVSNAADQRMAHLRTFQTGKHGDFAAQLINEIAVARVCLLSPARRNLYDQNLRKAIRMHAEDVAHAEQMGGVSMTLGQFLKQIQGDQPSPAEEVVARTRPLWVTWTAVSGAAVALLLVLGLIIILGRGTSGRPAEEKTALVFDLPENQRDGVRVVISGVPLEMPPEGPLVCPCKPGKHPIRIYRAGFQEYKETVEIKQDQRRIIQPTWVAEGQQLAQAEPAEEKPSTPPPPPQPAKAERSLGDLMEKDQPEPPAKSKELDETTLAKLEPKLEPELKPAEPNEQPKSPREEGKKHAVPPAAAQDEILKQLAEGYKIDTLDTPAARLDVAKELLDLSEKSRGNPTERFAILRKAMELASDGGDASMMFQVVDKIATDYEIRPMEVKHRMLLKFATNAHDAPRIKALVDSASTLIAQAIDADRYDLAVDLANAALRACQKSSGLQFRKQMFDHRAHVQRLADQWQEVQKGLDTLKHAPDDGDANLVVGRWYCLAKGNWAKGLPHLSKGSDRSLGKLAERELASPPTDSSEQVKLADGWYDSAQHADGVAKTALLLHAGDWYRKAEPDITSAVIKAKITRRLEEIQKSRAPADER